MIKRKESIKVMKQKTTGITSTDTTNNL